MSEHAKLNDSALVCSMRLARRWGTGFCFRRSSSCSSGWELPTREPAVSCFALLTAAPNHHVCVLIAVTVAHGSRPRMVWRFSMSYNHTATRQRRNGTPQLMSIHVYVRTFACHMCTPPGIRTAEELCSEVSQVSCCMLAQGDWWSVPACCLAAAMHRALPPLWALGLDRCVLLRAALPESGW